jgi:tetratricopeptide (TPR) repeat protein
MERQLQFSILQYLGSLKGRNFDDEGLEVAIQCISEALSLDVVPPLAVPLPWSLEETFEAGYSVLHDQRFSSFLAMLQGKAYFAGLTEGTSAYKERLGAARAKYDEKYGITTTSTSSSSPPPSNMPMEQLKAEANALKGEGNKFLSAGCLDEAIACYTKAIAIDDTNAVFPSNRAAALITLNR